MGVMMKVRSWEGIVGGTTAYFPSKGYSTHVKLVVPIDITYSTCRRGDSACCDVPSRDDSCSRRESSPSTSCPEVWAPKQLGKYAIVSMYEELVL